MIQKFRTFQYYVRAFSEAVSAAGWRFALRRATGFIHGRVRPKVAHSLGIDQAPKRPDGIHSIVNTLPMITIERPLLLIVSDSQIRQCIHYRIHQKIKYLESIGLRSMHISPAETGRLRSYLALSHTVIVYRTAVAHDLLQEFRRSGARLVFEFDDLVVGTAALEQSNILNQVTRTQAAHLIDLSARFLKTAQACDAIIVSTPYLADVYKRSENGLADKAVFVVPNFVETDAFSSPAAKDFTFAFTSPSGSIGREVEMLLKFLKEYDKAAKQDWNILVMGNDQARKTIEESIFRRGRVVPCGFLAFDEYIDHIRRAETVLIPLSDSGFNHAKTAIRLLDAAICGTQVLFSPIGAYRNIQAELHDRSLCIDTDSWGSSGAKIRPVLERLDANVADLQRAVRRIYGREAAVSCYRQVFLHDLRNLEATTSRQAAA